MAGRPWKEWSLKTPFLLPTKEELVAFDAIQACFTNPRWLIHQDKDRRLYIDVDMSQESSFSVMAFYVKVDYVHANLKIPPPVTAMEPILFLSRLLIDTKKNYQATELEVLYIIWAIRKLHRIIEAALEYLTLVVYIDHITTINLAYSLSIASLDRLNLRLVRAL